MEKNFRDFKIATSNPVTSSSTPCSARNKAVYLYVPVFASVYIFCAEWFMSGDSLYCCSPQVKPKGKFVSARQPYLMIIDLDAILIKHLFFYIVIRDWLLNLPEIISHLTVLEEKTPLQLMGPLKEYSGRVLYLLLREYSEMYAKTLPVLYQEPC